MSDEIDEIIDYFSRRFIDAIVSVIVVILVLWLFEPLIMKSRLYGNAIFEVLTRR